MQPPAAAVIEAHGILQRLIADLGDRQVTEASLLPGWTRGHVLAHLTDNARMFARLTEHALRGELVETYEGGTAGRNAAIDATARRSAAGHRAALAAQTARLESAWRGLSDQDWSRPVRFRDADIAATVYARWREAWIHMVDLDLGVRPDAWPAGLASHVIDFLLARLPARTSLLAQDTRQRWSTGGEARTLVTGGMRDLAAWLAGRTPVAHPVAPGGLPDLGAWPPHPARHT